MFGCGLPVCALAYSCIGELVSHKHNGLLFSTPQQLAQQLVECFRAEGGGAGGSALLAQLRKGVLGASLARWHDTWRKTVLPVLQGSGGGGGGVATRAAAMKAKS